MSVSAGNNQKPEIRPQSRRLRRECLNDGPFFVGPGATKAFARLAAIPGVVDDEVGFVRVRRRVAPAGGVAAMDGLGAADWDDVEVGGRHHGFVSVSPDRKSNIVSPCLTEASAIF
jgi:hypothetical protein